MHNAAFAALGLDMAYVALPVAAPAVEEAVVGLRALGFRGANVTMPHKATVIPFLDDVSDAAGLVGAVNTIVFDEMGSHGHNTDVPGFAHALRDGTGASLAGGSALVLGAGGAARAAVLALIREQLASITVVNRSLEHADALVARLSPVAGDARLASCGLSELHPGLVSGADLVVNCSALGMSQGDKVPVGLADNIRSDHIVFDVVYGKRPTQLISMARAVQAKVIDGLAMLVWQAAFAFELWTGRVAPLEVMRSAASE
jgi:shikimate dehydrogenase